jgi:hypothetical protein
MEYVVTNKNSIYKKSDFIKRCNDNPIMESIKHPYDNHSMIEIPSCHNPGGENVEKIFDDFESAKKYLINKMEEKIKFEEIEYLKKIEKYKNIKTWAKNLTEDIYE